MAIVLLGGLGNHFQPPIREQQSSGRKKKEQPMQISETMTYILHLNNEGTTEFLSDRAAFG